jgi:hypothetical protein
VLTGANDEQFKQFHLDEVPYEVFIKLITTTPRMDVAALKQFLTDNL